MTFFILKQLPVLPPTTYSETDVLYVSSRVTELIYTADDMSAFGYAIGKEAPTRWNEVRRASVLAEIDAYYAHLYGLTRDELRYILDPKDVFGTDFPSETFRVLKQREEKEYGEYRTRRLVLEAFDRLAESPRFRDDVPKRESALEIPQKHAQSVAD